MNEKKIVRAARWAKANGYQYMASVVKQVFRTTYYHVVPVQDIIENGDWIPAPVVWGMPWRGRYGQKTLPESTCLRAHALTQVD